MHKFPSSTCSIVGALKEFSLCNYEIEISVIYTFDIDGGQ